MAPFPDARLDWLVDPPRLQVTVFAPRGEAFDAGTVHRVGETFGSALLPRLAVDVASLFPPQGVAG